MLESLQALLGLQEIDRHIYRVQSELTRLPKELEARQESLQRMDVELDAKRRALHEMRAGVKEIEDVTTQQRQRIRKLEGEAHKTKTDVALLAAYDHEIRGLKRTVSQAEEDGLALIEKVEAAEAEITAGEAALAEEQKILAEFKANVDKEMADAQERLAALQADLETKTSSGVPSEHLALYRRLLISREGEALAELQGRICQGCFVEIPRNLAVKLAQGVELIQCPWCDRILHPRD